VESIAAMIFISTERVKKLGILYGGLQYSVLKIAQEFNMSSSQMGALVSLFFCAITVSPLLVGAISDKVGKKIVIMAVGVSMVLSSLVCIVSHSVMTVRIGVFLAGMSMGPMEGTATAALSDYNQIRAGKYINLMQAVLSGACFVTPLMMQFVMNVTGSTWRVLYIFVACVSVILLHIALQTKFDVMPVISNNDKTNSNLSVGVFSSGLATGTAKVFLLAITFCIIIYDFVEAGITYFADSFISLNLNAPALSATGIALFWLGAMFSRCFSGILFKHENKIVVICLFGTILCLIVFAFTNSVIIALASYGFVGVFCGPVWPFLASKINRAFPDRTGLMSSLILIASGVGGMISPYLLGVLSADGSYSEGNIVLAFATVISIVLYLTIGCKDRIDV